MNADAKIQKMITLYTMKTGIEDPVMRDVVDYAIEKHGWTPPKPRNPRDIMAARFAQAARLDIRTDEVTKRPYRGRLSFQDGMRDGKKLFRWLDTDAENATYFKMKKAINNYREQIIGEVVQGMDTTDHWNRRHPGQMSLVFETDLTDEVQWRKNGEGDRKAG